MIIDVGLYDSIQSPLPARRASLPTDTPPLSEDIPAVPTPPPVTELKPITPKRSGLPFPLFLGLLLLLVLAGGAIALKVLLPTVGGKGVVNDVTLTYWGLWESNPVLGGIISDFEQKNPGIKIKYQMQDKVNYRSRLSGRLEKGATDGSEAPDIFRIHNSWLPMFANYLAPVPATTSTAIKLEEDYYKSFSELKLNNRYVAVPLMYDQLALYYNSDLLTKAGVLVPKTWWGFRNAAKQLTVRNGAQITVSGAAIGTVENIDHWSDIIGLLLKQNGVNPNSKDPVQIKKLTDVLTFYTLFKTNDKIWDETMPNALTAFANGNVAFYFAPSWRVFDIEAINASLPYEITGVPQLPTLPNIDESKIESGEINGQLTNIQWSTYWAEGVNNKSKHQKEAWKFIEFLSSQDSLAKLYKAASDTRGFGEIYPRKSMQSLLTGNKRIVPFVMTADSGTGWYLSSRTFDEGLNDNMAKYFADAINAIESNNTQPADAIVPLQNGIGRLTDQYKLVTAP